MDAHAKSVSRYPLAVVLTVGGLYVAQSVIGGMTWTGLAAVMRDRGLPLDSVGLLSLIALPWALKFLWSPAVERFRLPASGRNRSDIIVMTGGGICAAALVLIGLIGPESLWSVLACLTIVAFAASTVDIACDGYAVESLAKKYYGWGNAAQVGGAYLGSAIGGGLFLILVASIGWRYAAWSMALMLVLLGLPFLFHARRDNRPVARSHIPSLMSALQRPEIRRGLMATAVYVLGQKVALGMLGPFLIDAGFDLATIGLLNGLGSMFIGFTAALLGGKLVRSWGTRRVLLTALLLQAAALAVFALQGLTSSVPQPLLVTVAVVSASCLMPLGFVALYAQFMEWSDPRQGGIDFTLFQSMDALVSMIGGVGAGYVANYFGYGFFFACASIIALAALPAMGLVIRASVRQDPAMAEPHIEKGLSS